MAEVTDGRRVIQASEILEKIQKGEPVEYDGVIIEGDLDLSKLDLPIKHIERTEAQRGLCLPEDAKLVVSTIKITNAEINGLLDFTEIIFQHSIKFRKSQFNGRVSFENATFRGGASFESVTFSEMAFFRHATFSEMTFFDNATFSETALFYDATFSVHPYFSNAAFRGGASFDNATFRGGASFNNATFSGNDASFKSASFSGNAFFDNATFSERAIFDNATFNGYASFKSASFSGEVLTFKNAVFNYPDTQEYACRRAKIMLEKNGDREEAGYHFYKEMDGKRRQKPWYVRYPELIFIQWIFGYGVHPLRLWLCWFGFVGLFAIIYWLGSGIDEIVSQLNGTAEMRDYLWFSIATAVTPGYAGYKPTPDFKLVAGLEAIFGTFMWAAFIATFARKYMR